VIEDFGATVMFSPSPIRATRCAGSRCNRRSACASACRHDGTGIARVSRGFGWAVSGQGGERFFSENVSLL
jgi:hypothetical protein